MGEMEVVSSSLGTSSRDSFFSRNFQTGKERVLTPAELMSIPPTEQIVHVKGVGFFRCRMLLQNQIAPYCFDLAPNPLEGGRLPPDPIITLSTPKDVA